MVVNAYPDAEGLSQAAAGIIAQQARQAVEARGRFSLVLSGGSTPRKTYELLAQTPYKQKIPWDKVDVFWGDERCVPPDDPRSNASMARLALLDHVPIPISQIHPIPGTISPALAAVQYEKVIQDYFGRDEPRFDLILLGLGSNGHTASLFPGTPVLAETTRWVARVYVPEQNLWRITLTFPIINRAAFILFLVTGEDKSLTVRQVLQGAKDLQNLPAQMIAPQNGELYWLLDKAASQLLNLKA